MAGVKESDEIVRAAVRDLSNSSKSIYSPGRQSQGGEPAVPRAEEKRYFPPLEVRRETLARRCQFRAQGEQFVGRGDDAFAAVLETIEVVTQAETHQVVADELGGGQAAAQFVIEFPGPVHELGRDFARVGVVIGLSFGQDVPDGDEEFASDGDDSLLLADAGSEFVKNSLPIDRIADGGPGGFDESGTEVATTLLGNAAALVGFAGIMDSATESGISNDFLVLGEAIDSADGAENGHGVDEAEAGQLDDKGHHVGPGFGDTEASEFLFGFVDERGEIVDDGHVVAGAEFLGRGDIEAVPPLAVGDGEEVARWGDNAVAVEQAVQPVPWTVRPGQAWQRSAERPVAADEQSGRGVRVPAAAAPRLGGSCRRRGVWPG